MPSQTATNDLANLLAKLSALCSEDRREIELHLAIIRASPALREEWIVCLDLVDPSALTRSCAVLLLNEISDDGPEPGSLADVTAASNFLGGLSASSAALAADQLAEIESAYEAAKGTWTGRTWDDGDKITPESTDDAIAGIMTRGNSIGVTCWGADESDEHYRRRVKIAIAKLEAAWVHDGAHANDFAAACEELRGLAEESDAGVADRAAVAEQDAAHAIAEARAGNKHSALEHAEHAAKVEREFGDAPTWGPFAEAMRAWSEHGK